MFSTTFLRDAGERIFWTFVYSVIQYLITATVYDVETLKAALLAAVPVVLVTVKALIASQVGDPDTAALKL